MQECFLEEKWKGLLIHSCRSVNVALDGKMQFSFWNLHENVVSVLKGFNSLQLKWQEISLKIPKVAVAKYIFEWLLYLR